jgi:hypothetical protein
MWLVHEVAPAQAEQVLLPLQRAFTVKRDLLPVPSGHFAGEGLRELKTFILPRFMA